MYIRRALIKAIGPLDKSSFPMGYGEEVDYSQRAVLAGWTNVVAPHVFVKHLRSQSFGVERRKQLVAASKVILWDRFPRMLDDVAVWESSIGAALVEANAMRIRSAWRGGEVEPRTCVVSRTSDDPTATPTVRLVEGTSPVGAGTWCHPDPLSAPESEGELARSVLRMVVLGGAEAIQLDDGLDAHESLLAALAQDLGVVLRRSRDQYVTS
jgi:hypothetical protein